MIKLYKTDEQGKLLYKEAWIKEEEKKGIIHQGKVGCDGKSQDVDLAEMSSSAFLEKFKSDTIAEGYRELNPSKLYWLVVQFPMKSKLGAKRDRWLRDKVSEYLDNVLGWKGLGHVDGFDIGNFKLNVFCVVVHEEIGVKAVKGCLRTYRLDFTRALIATRGYDSEEDYALKYSHKKDVDFSVN